MRIHRHGRRLIGSALGLVVVVAAAAVAWPALWGSPSEESPPPTSIDETAAAAGPTPPTTVAIDPAIACIQSWELRAQVAQLVAIAVDGGALEAEAQRVADLGLGGVLLQRPQAGGLADGIADFKAVSAIAPLVMADEEGGEVQTLSAALGPLPGPAEMAATSSPTEAQAIVARHAEAVAAAGIDLVLGPVVDVAAADGSGPLAGRIFGSDPQAVAEYGLAYVEAYREAGVTTVLKHFPGHGSASGDSHEGPVSVPPTDALRARDLLPYETLLPEVDAVMVGHLVVPDLTGLAATSQSPEAIDGLLRDEYGHGGLVITDSLSMGAIAFRTPPTEAAIQAIDSGADIALFVTIDDPGAVVDALVTATERGRLDRTQVATAVSRVLAMKGIEPCSIEA